MQTFQSRQGGRVWRLSKLLEGVGKEEYIEEKEKDDEKKEEDNEKKKEKDEKEEEM